MDKNLKDQLDAANKLNATLKETQKSTTQLTKNFGSVSDAINNLRAESITSFREFNSGISQTINLFSKLSDLAKTRFTEIGNQINITTGVTQDLVGIIGEAVSKASENFELNSDIEESTRAVKRNLLENESIRSRITDAARLEYENQEKYLTGLDIAYNKKVKELRLKEDEVTNQQNLIDSIQNNIQLTTELLNLSTSQADKTYYSNILAKQSIDLEEAKIDSKEKQLNLDMAAEAAATVLSQKQNTLKNGYKSIEDAQKRITDAIDQATDSTVKLSIDYKRYGNAVNAVADAQVSSGEVLQKFNQMVADQSRKDFEESYAAKLKGSKDISKISKEEYDLQFRRNSLEKSLIDASKLRSDILSRIAQQGGVKTKLDEEELRVAEDIITQGKVQLVNLDESIEKLAVVEKYQKHVHHELEKQNIAKHAANEITAGLTNLLGDAGGELLNIGKAIQESMVSPLALVGALIGTALEEFMKIGEANKSFMETSKLNASQIEHLSHVAHDLSLEYRAQGLEYNDVLNTAGALVNQFGTLNQVSDVAVEKASLLGKAFGVSADSAAGVIAQLQRSTGASAETAGNIAALGANFAKAAGVAPDAVMADIAGSSEEIATYFKGTEKDLFKTAVEARRLGLDLKKVANISQSLLNFESSIEDQMTASVLLGREINLDKARQLAMEGKIQEAAEETLKQVGSLSEFNKMNAVQKEAIAKAAGMSVGDLQKSLQAQEALSKMTAEQRLEYEKGLQALNAGNEVTAEKLLQDQRNQVTQQKIADAVAKISEIFANVILPVLEPIFNGLLGIFNIVEPLLPILKGIVQLLLIAKVATLAWQGVLRLISFMGAKKELLSIGGLLKGIKAGSLGLWAGFKNITGITSAVQATKAFSAAKAMDTGITATNTSANTLNSAQMAVYRAQRLAGVSATKALAAARGIDTGITNSNTGSQIKNTLANSKLGKAMQSLGTMIKGTSIFKAADTAITNSNTLAQTRNALANSKVGQIIGGIAKFFGLSRLFKLQDATATTINTGAQVASIAPTTAAGTAAGSAAFGWAALGFSLAAVGLSIAAVIYSISSLASAFAQLKPEQLSALQDVLLGLGIGILAFTGIIAGLVYSGVLPAAAGGLIALGAAALMIGAGVLLAATGMTLLASAFKQLPAEDVSNLGIALFSLAGGLGAIALASIGFVIALPAILAMTGALMLLAPVFDQLGGAVAGLSTGFTSLMESIKSMPASELFASAAGFISLAGALGVFTLASIGLLASVPAVSILTGALLLLGPAISAIGAGINSVATGFQILVASINQLNPELLTAMSGAFLNMALALGAVTVAIVATAALAPAATLLATVLGTLGVSALLVGVGLKLAEGAIASITSSLTNLVTNVSGNALNSMSDGLISLAGGIGILAIASVALYPAIPALAILTGAMALLGPVLKVVGEGVNYISIGFQNLANAVKQINPETMFSIAAAFGSVALALGALSVAIVTTAAFAPAAILLAGVMTTLGISAIMVGIGLKLASSAIESITNSLLTLTSNISPSILDAMKSGLFSLAEGIGAVGLAAIGFTLAIPSVTLFSLLMGSLGSNLISVGTGMTTIISNLNAFVTSVNTVLPMIDQINLLTDAFSNLAESIGEVGIASILAGPAMMALGGITSLVSGLFSGGEASVAPVAATPGPVGAGTIPTTTAATAPGPAAAAAPAIDIEGLMVKLDSLISAVNNQPIQLVVNGKVLAEVVGRNTSRTGAAFSK
jgi:hypothetical protein